MRLVITVFISFLLAGCYQQQPKKLNEKVAIDANVDFNCQNTSFPDSILHSTIFNVLESYNSKDKKAIDRLIHPSIGLYVLFSRGTVNEWTNIKEFDFKTTTEINNSKIPYWHSDFLLSQKLIWPGDITKIETSYFLDCDSLSDEGLCVLEDQTKKLILSSTIKELFKFSELEENMTEAKKRKYNEEISKVSDWEACSYRIELAVAGDDLALNSFIFHLTPIEGQLYLTVIDLATLECSV